MDNKIQELADKLLQEGVAKGNAEADRIISEANKKAEDIIEKAKADAADIVAGAKKQSEELFNNTKSELKMFNSQALNALKSEIATVVSDKVIKSSVKSMASDKNFLNEFMLKIASKWCEQESIKIETADADSLKAYFAKNAKQLLDGKVEIKQVNGNPANFTVSPSDGSYKVNFGEAEFENYFKSFLRPQLIDLLF